MCTVLLPPGGETGDNQPQKRQMAPAASAPKNTLSIHQHGNLKEVSAPMGFYHHRTNRISRGEKKNDSLCNSGASIAMKHLWEYVQMSNKRSPKCPDWTLDFFLRISESFYGFKRTKNIFGLYYIWNIMYYKHGENNATFYLCTSEDTLLAMLKVFFLLCFFFLFWLTFFPTPQKKKPVHKRFSD